MARDKDLSVIIVDQHEEVCHRLARSLQGVDGVDVVAHTSNVMLAAELAHQLSPDVILADFTWGKASRADTLRWIGHMAPKSKLVVYAAYYTAGEREEFAAAGAERCLLKGLAVEELAGELRKASPSANSDGKSRAHLPALSRRPPETVA